MSRPRLASTLSGAQTRLERVPSALLLLLVLSASLSGCQSAGLVERRAGTASSYGRKVPGEAYAWYNRGQYHERMGELDDASYAYEQALQIDERSGSAWGALLRVRCQRHPQAALEAFERGRDRAEELLPLLIAASSCAKREDRNSDAIRYARSALTLEPQSEAASLALVEALEGAGDHAAAALVSRAFELFRGYALIRPPQLAPEHQFADEKQARESADSALLRGDLEGARQGSVGTLGDGEIALRAALLGKPALARSLASRILALDGTNGEAIMALLLTGELEPNVELSLSDEVQANSLGLIARQPSPLLLCAYAVWMRSRLGDAHFEGLSRLCPVSPTDALQTELSRYLTSLGVSLPNPAP